MKRTVLVDQRQEPFHQRLTAEVAELAKIDRVPKMVAGVRVAPGAGEGALACDLDRQDGPLALQHPPPGTNDVIFHSRRSAGDCSKSAKREGRGKPY